MLTQQLTQLLTQRYTTHFQVDTGAAAAQMRHIF